MPPWPEAPTRLMPRIITTASQAASGRAIAACAATAPGSLTPGVAIQNFSPLYVSEPITIQKVGWYNGTAVNGNVELAIYGESFVQLQTTGSIAQAGTSVVQAVDWADLTLGPGLYYVAIGIDSTTAALFVHGLPALDPLAGIGPQNYAKIATLPLPDPLSGFAPSNFMPLWALATRTLFP